MAEIHDGHVYYIGVQLNPNRVIEASKDDGVHRAFISQNRNEAIQRWRARKFEGEWAFQNIMTNEYLGGGVDGLPQTAVTSPLGPSENQIIRWSVRKNQNVKPITNAAFEDKVLDLQGSVIADGTPILFWGYHGGENQKWQFLET